MSQYVEYIAQVGDTWSIIAERAYGNAYRFPAIIKANPKVPIRTTLDAGTVISVPIDEEAETVTSNLPPWKQ